MAQQRWTRRDRVADLIQRELALMLQRDVRDKRLGLVTINEVKVSRDLAFADVYYTVMGAEAGETQKLLKSAAGFLRRGLGRVLTTRVTPSLRFHFDASMEYGQRMTRLLDKALGRDSDSAIPDDQSGGKK